MSNDPGPRIGRRSLSVVAAGAAAMALSRPVAAAGEAEARAAAWLRAYDAQGHHRTGQLADLESADWLATQAAALGAVVTRESFAIDRIEPADCYVELDGTRIPAVPMFDAAFTRSDGIEGRLGADASAEIGLSVMGPLAIYQPEYEAFRRSPRRALVTVTKGDEPGLALFNAEHFLAPYGVPNVLVASTAEAALTAAAARGAQLRVVADVRRVPSDLVNVVATVPGRRGDARPVVVMTPRSGWGHCASERGGGIVCWLEVLRALQAAPPAATVVLVASSGHELGHIGLDDFMERRKTLVTGADWLHFGANIGATDSRLALQSPQDDLRRSGSEALAGAGHPATLAPATTVPLGESRAIHRAGGRYLTFIGSNAKFHLPQDRWPDAVDLPAVTRIAGAAAQVAVAMAG